MKRILTILCLLSACVAFGQNSNIIPGKIRVKLKQPARERMILHTQTAGRQGVRTTQTGQPLSVGLESLDALNKTNKATAMYRVFPYAGKYEARQMKAGLHLWYDIEVSGDRNPVDLAKIYMTDANIEIAEPVLRIRKVADETPFTPNDPDYTKQWHYKNTGQSGGTPGVDIRLPEAWNTTKGKGTVIVAVVDEGIEYTHDDLKDNMWVNGAELNGTPGVDDDGNGYIDDIYGFNFVDGYGINPNNNVQGPGPIVPGNHGTHVGGTIAAATNNGKGGAGVAGGDGATGGVKIMSCQTMVENVEAGAYIGAAIAYAADNGAVILQNSWGFGEEGYHSQSVLDAIRYFIRYAGTDETGTVPYPGTPMMGGIVIFAAGNDNSSGNWYPARYEEVMAVASVNHYGTRAYYSNYGNWVDISAPGGDTREALIGGIYSCLKGNTYGYYQGTSMACPHVSGIAALALSVYGSESYTPNQLWDRMIISVNPLPQEALFRNGQMGAGLIDAEKMVAGYIPVTAVNMAPDFSIYLNRSATCTATVLPANATDPRIEWSSADETIAIIDNSGKVQGLALGTVTITATSKADANHKATAVLTVLPVPVESIMVVPPSMMLQPGETQALTPLFTPDDATDQSVQWTSTNSSIASIDPTGMVQAESVGTAIITATTNDGGYVSSSTVTVVQPVTGVLLNRSNIRMVVGDTLTLRATVLPDDAYNKSVLWSINSSAVASVTSGKVQAKSTGTAQITVRTNDGDFTAFCDLDVYDAAQAPEGFSPNNDGINDYFELVINSQDTYSLTVFDRSGQIYYRTADYDNNWDGTANTGKYNGSKVPAGTYFYQLTGNKSGGKSGYIVIKY